MPPAGPGGVLPFFLEEAALPQERPLLLDRLGTVTLMSILNRRNAIVGWLTTKVVKRVVKKKAADAVPTARTGGATAGALAALGGALFFWKKKRSGSSGE
jgi:hypothetical protein